MKLSPSQLYMAAIKLLAESTVRGEDVPEEDLQWAIDLAQRTANLIEEDKDVTDEEVKEIIEKAFSDLDDIKHTQLVKTIAYQNEFTQKKALYIIQRAASMNIIYPDSDKKAPNYSRTLKSNDENEYIRALLDDIDWDTGKVTWSIIIGELCRKGITSHRKHKDILQSAQKLGILERKEGYYRLLPLA